jgi:hypothetical protein
VPTVLNTNRPASPSAWSHKSLQNTQAGSDLTNQTIATLKLEVEDLNKKCTKLETEKIDLEKQLEDFQTVRADLDKFKEEQKAKDESQAAKELAANEEQKQRDDATQAKINNIMLAFNTMKAENDRLQSTGRRPQSGGLNNMFNSYVTSPMKQAAPMFFGGNAQLNESLGSIGDIEDESFSQNGPTGDWIQPTARNTSRSPNRMNTSHQGSEPSVNMNRYAALAATLDDEEFVPPTLNLDTDVSIVDAHSDSRNMSTASKEEANLSAMPVDGENE